MKNMLKVVTLIATVALIAGAMLTLGFNAAADYDVAVWSGEINRDFTVNYVCTVAIDPVTQAIRDAIAANGTPKAVKIEVDETTAWISGPDGYASLGFLSGDEEIWGDTDLKKANGVVTYTKANLSSLNSTNTQLAIFDDGSAGDITHIGTISIVFTFNGDEPVSTIVSTVDSEIESFDSIPESEIDSEIESVPESGVDSEPEESVIDSTADESDASADESYVAVKLGDVNGDDNIDLKDVLMLRKFIAGMSDMTNSAAADANGDGNVDLKDVLMLRKYIANMIDTL